MYGMSFRNEFDIENGTYVTTSIQPSQKYTLEKRNPAYPVSSFADAQWKTLKSESNNVSDSSRVDKHAALESGFCCSGNNVCVDSK